MNAMAENSIAIEKLNHRLTSQDATFIYGESRNGPLHIGSISFFEDEIAYPELMQHFESKLPLVPRYRQRLIPVPFDIDHAAFEDDPDFKLENHVKLHQLPEDASEEQLIEAAMAVFSKPLDRNRPLWETHLFNGFKGNRSVIMWSIHHCLVDGVSGMELLNVVMDFRPDPPAETGSNLEPWSPGSLPSRLRRVLGATLDRAQEQVDSMRRLSRLAPNFRLLVKDLGSDASAAARLARQMMRPIAATPWNAGLVSQERTLAWLRTSFAEIRAIRAAFGGTINDVVLTMLSEGAARYIRDHHAQPGAPFRIGCPVNVRHDDENGALGNRVSMMFPEMPAEPMDPVARLKLVTAETQRIKEAGEPQALERLMSYSESAPPAFVATLCAIATTAIDAAVSFQRILPWARRAVLPLGINFIATNIPGSQVPLYLAGHRMVDYVGLLPLGGNLGFGVPIISYNQNLYFTMMAEPNLMPDPDRMKSLVEQVFEELKQAAVAQSVPAAAQAPAVKGPKHSALPHARVHDTEHPEVAALNAT
jgi:diacylglycerol O-acyltransferase